MDIVKIIRDRYRGGRDRLFVLHGNTGDLFPFVGSDGKTELLTLPDYLYRALTAGVEGADRRIWMHYALGFGIRWVNDEKAQGAQRIAKLLGGRGEDMVAFATKPLDFFRMVELVVRRREKPAADKEGPGSLVPLRIVATEAHLVIPDAQPSFMRPEDRELLVLLRRFAAEPAYDATDTFIVLVTDALSGIHRELREVAVTIEVPRPSETEIADYLGAALERHKGTAGADELPQMRRLAVGLTRRQVENVVAEAGATREILTATRLTERRKELIARDFGEFLEFFEPSWTLDEVGGSGEAVSELRELAAALKGGDRDIPSGIILAGQNGIGKTFLAKAFLGTTGITGVVLRPVKDPLLGMSERNWEKVAVALRSAGQIGILVDEADAQMGQRTGPNVHEVSRTLFAAQMQLMGDPVYRGKIFWILMTCRPDKLAPDVKRPGRCERLIPLFPITSQADAVAMMKAQIALLARREGYLFADELLGGAFASDEAVLQRLIGKTGAQVENRVLRRAKKRYAKGSPITLDQVRRVLEADREFESEPEAYELQRLLAIADAIETENEDLIPVHYRKEVQETLRGVAGLRGRIDELRTRLDGV